MGFRREPELIIAARTGKGWDEYAATRERMVAKMGPPPDTIPGNPDHPYWQVIRRLYFYDPVPTLRQLQTPTLALWGELDNNVLAEKNKAAWEAALKAGGNRDYTLTILPKANHMQWEARVGSNAEMKSLQRFVPSYFTTIHAWLAKRIQGFEMAQWSQSVPPHPALSVCVSAWSRLQPRAFRAISHSTASDLTAGASRTSSVRRNSCPSISRRSIPLGRQTATQRR
jgi:Prolyl oligopeptidase family